MKHIFSFLVSILLICLLLFSTCAFSYMEISENEIFTIRENIKIETLDSFSETDKQSFSCFDISPSEKIVLKIDNGQKKNVIVLNAKGDFLYGFTLKTYGDIGVGWDNDNVVIYYVRSDVAVALNEQADILSIKKIADTIENNSYWNQSVYAKRRICGESTYIMKNSHTVFDILGSSTILQKVDANGNVTVLYDASQSFYKSFVIIVILLVLVLGIFSAIFIYKKHRTIRGRQSGDGSLIVTK